jgi:hypothetical protein
VREQVAEKRAAPNVDAEEFECPFALGLDRISRCEYAEDNDFLHQPGTMLGTLRLNLNFEVRKGASA